MFPIQIGCKSLKIKKENVFILIHIKNFIILNGNFLFSPVAYLKINFYCTLCTSLYQSLILLEIAYSNFHMINIVTFLIDLFSHPFTPYQNCYVIFLIGSDTLQKNVPILIKKFVNYGQIFFYFHIKPSKLV